MFIKIKKSVFLQTFGCILEIQSFINYFSEEEIRRGATPPLEILIIYVFCTFFDFSYEEILIAFFPPFLEFSYEEILIAMKFCAIEVLENHRSNY